MREEIERALKNSENKVIYMIKKAESSIFAVTKGWRSWKASRQLDRKSNNTTIWWPSARRHDGNSWCIAKLLVSPYEIMKWWPPSTKSHQSWPLMIR